MKVWSHPQSGCVITGEELGKYCVVFSFILWLGNYVYKFWQNQLSSFPYTDFSSKYDFFGKIESLYSTKKQKLS
jgi:hypothetical protein